VNIYETAAAGTPVRVGIFSGPFALQAGTLTLYDTAPTGKQLFVVTLDSGKPDRAFLYPDSYDIEPIGEDNADYE
jgi:hypothetical protein